jgi:hypothetical protein
VPLGETLVELCSHAKDSLLLVAPFAKRASLERVLRRVPAAVPVRCITRWIPEEIIAGVSDLEVWPLLQERGNASLAIRRDLHAKYYRADGRCLVGSANLTHAALGWRATVNLELLLPMNPGDAPLQSFERELSNATEVTEELYQEYQRAVREIRAFAPPPIVTGALVHGKDWPLSEDIAYVEDPDAWIPTLRHPAHLFDAYRGNLEKLTTASRTDAARDFRAFTVPPGLPRRAFEAHIRLQLLQMPIVRDVDALVAEPQRFGAVRDFLGLQPCAKHPGFDPSAAWQTLLRWLLYFAVDRYRHWTPNFSELFQRRSRIS